MRVDQRRLAGLPEELSGRPTCRLRVLERGPGCRSALRFRASSGLNDRAPLVLYERAARVRCPHPVMAEILASASRLRMASICGHWSPGARKLPAIAEHVRPAGVLRRALKPKRRTRIQAPQPRQPVSPVYLPGWARQVDPRSRHHAQMPGLSEEDVDPDPISQFLSWYEYAPGDPVALVTASPQGLPSGRMVLLKGVDKSGFVFFTNYGSPKARDLAANPRAALLFFWPPDRQVRVSGWVPR